MKAVKIKQRDMTDCGAACLASVAAYHKLKIPVSRIRQLASTDKKGTNLLGMIEAAKAIGFDARGVRGEMQSLSQIPKPAIAHVVVKEVLHHYVVIYEVTVKHIQVMDPGDGLLHQYSFEEFRKIWSGVLLLLWPGNTFNIGDSRISSASRFRALIHPHRKILVQALFGALIYTILGLATAIYVQKIVDYVLADGNANLLNLMSTVMLSLLCIQVFVGATKSILTLRTGQLIDAHLILGYYKHLLSLPQQFFDTMRTGEILSRINDAVKIRTFINDAAIALFVNFFIVLFSLVFMFAYHSKLALLALSAIPLYILVYLITNYLNKKVERTLMERSAILESQLVESLNAVATIKSFGLEPQTNLKTEAQFVSLLKSVYHSGLNGIFSSTASELTARVFTILALWVGSRFVMDNEMTPGALLSFYTLIGYFTGPVGSLIGMNKVAQNAMIAADRLFEILDLKQEQEFNNKLVLQRDMIGDIQFRKVKFRYGTRTEIFENLSLNIPASSITAIVGESGSGKSTLLSILQNLYPTHGGQILIGNYNLEHIDRVSLRNLIGVVPQKIDLFAGNVVENIAIGDERPDMKKIINLCHDLGILDFIEKLPAGFNTYLGENGATLSGGQKQRLAIARALYRDPQILMLDEATSSLDSVAEKYVQRIIRLLREQNKTVIIIAHRLSTVYKADKIVVMEKGNLIEEGTHTDLLAHKGKYHQLWQHQYHGVDEREEIQEKMDDST